jgi:AbiV family abortive infection protein
MGKKGEWTIIPKEIIPSIIKACWKNYQRLRKDAEILFEAKSYQSAIERSLLSIEELAKVIVLLWYYKKQDVPVEIVKKLFTNHNYHFKEFIKYLFSGLSRGGFDKPELLKLT